MAHFLLKYSRNEKKRTVASEMIRIEAVCLDSAKDKAEDAADSRGGARASLQLFNEIGLVATRSQDGRWSI